MLDRYTQFFGDDQADHRIDTLTDLGCAGDQCHAGIVVDFQHCAAAIRFVNFGAARIVYRRCKANTFFVTAVRVSQQPVLFLLVDVV